MRREELGNGSAYVRRYEKESEKTMGGYQEGRAAAELCSTSGARPLTFRELTKLEERLKKEIGSGQNRCFVRRSNSPVPRRSSPRLGKYG
ncbi:hypothetical protein KM043_006434 [Ampulex compressa]|nr:hypothetical protein KM043_006434 [Ampulex compressa]